MSDKINLPPILQEATYLYSFTWNSIDPDTEIESPVDTTGYSARIQLKRKVSDSVAIADWSTANGMLTIVGNKINVNVPGTATKNYDFSSALYDLLAWETADPSVAFQLAYGGVDFKKSVTSVS